MNSHPERIERIAPILRVCAWALVTAAAIAASQPTQLAAHEIITTRLTWTEQISRIFYHRCVSCHREGGQAPMPLATYEQVRPWAKAIKYAVLSRQMPPWDAVKGYGAFRNDLSLSEDDIAKISSWVEGGAPDGSAVFLPPMPQAESFAEPPQSSAKTINLSGKVTLGQNVTAAGIEPENVAEGGSLQATAYRPDGSVEPLIWLREYRPKWQRSYWFREPLVLPKGTIVMLFTAGPVSAKLLVAK
jgi:hypothetical protein